MVAQHLFSSRPTADDTLDVLWRSTALRISWPGRATLFGVGVSGVATSIITSRWPMIAAVGLIVSAFAAYAELIQPHDAQDAPGPARRVLARIASAIAAVAALTAGLLMLAAMFGGSIEVMRR